MLEPNPSSMSARSSLLFYILGGLVVFVSGGLVAWSVSSTVFVKRQTPLVLNATQLSLAVESTQTTQTAPSLALADCLVAMDPSTQTPRVDCQGKTQLQVNSGPQVAGEQISAHQQSSEKPKPFINTSFEDWILTSISVLASIWK